MKTIRTKPEPSCPKCGAKMVLRRPKEGQDWDAFWGCGRFPNCKGKMNIDSDGLPVDPYEDMDGWDGDVSD